MIKSIFSLFCTLVLLSGCSPQGTPHSNSLKVVASSVPHAELLEFVKPDLKEKGIDLEIIISDDYNMPNRALANREIDANFFQHIPFLEEQVKQFHYPIENYAKIELEPMGIYSKKISSLNDLKNTSTIAVPNDPTNEARAMLLLHKKGVIELDDPLNFLATPLNIVKNPKNLKFIEIDAAMLPRTLEDVDAAAINTNFAMQANLSPVEALVIEESNSPYANILAIRKGDEHRSELRALKNAMTSMKMRAHIKEKYNGAILPAF